MQVVAVAVLVEAVKDLVVTAEVETEAILEMDLMPQPTGVVAVAVEETRTTPTTKAVTAVLES